MSAKDFIVTLCAVVGAALGIFNLGWTVWKDRERLMVCEQYGFDDELFSLKVVNRSYFPVTIVRIQLHPVDSAIEDLDIHAERDAPRVLPKRIDARDAHTFSIDTVAEKKEVSYL